MICCRIIDFVGLPQLLELLVAKVLSLCSWVYWYCIALYRIWNWAVRVDHYVKMLAKYWLISKCFKLFPLNSGTTHLNLIVERDGEGSWSAQQLILSVVFVHGEYFQTKKKIIGNVMVFWLMLSAKMTLFLVDTILVARCLWWSPHQRWSSKS